MELLHRFFWVVEKCWKARRAPSRVEAVLALNTLVRLNVIGQEEADEFAEAAGL